MVGSLVGGLVGKNKDRQIKEDATNFSFADHHVTAFRIVSIGSIAELQTPSFFLIRMTVITKQLLKVKANLLHREGVE